MSTEIAILDRGYDSYSYEEELFSASGYDLRIYDGPARDRDLKYRFAHEAVGILVRQVRIDERALEIMKHLKAIVRYGVGYDNIDLDACRRRKIRVANVQGYANHSVSDHALALMFACTRDLEGSRSGTFSKPSRLEMFELHDKTLGIIGIGRIGSQFSLKATPLFKRILAYDPYKSKAYIKQSGAEKVGLSTLLKKSHVISLHCNLTGETRHMLDESAFNEMQERPLIINTARGAVIEENSLLNALKTGLVHSAGLDVYEKEPPGKDQEALLSHPHVVHTPHIAWYSSASIETLQRKAAKNLLGLLNGEQIEDELIFSP
jgi:D-3-phosphoglycerate dehydrogenase